jgi:hypothetical protein
MNKNIRNNLFLLGWGIFISALWFFSPAITEILFPPDSSLMPVDVATLPRNELGDTFGIITSLFTGAAFIGVAYSLILQRQDFDETIKVMNKQNELMAINMSLAMFPTVFRQKLRDLEKLLKRLEEIPDFETLSLETVSLDRINKWTETARREQKKYVDDVLYANRGVRIGEESTNKKKEELKLKITMWEEMVAAGKKERPDDPTTIGLEEQLAEMRKKFVDLQKLAPLNEKELKDVDTYNLGKIYADQKYLQFTKELFDLESLKKLFLLWDIKREEFFKKLAS